VPGGLSWAAREARRVGCRGESGFRVKKEKRSMVCLKIENLFNFQIIFKFAN
jgi:hypothetical protein